MTSSSSDHPRNLTTAPLKVRQIDPTRDPVWQRITEQSSSSLFSSPPWLRAIRDTYNWKINADILVDDQDDILAGFPYRRIADIRGDRRICLPFSDYCDPIVNEYSHWLQLVDPHFDAKGQIVVRTLSNPIPAKDGRLELADEAMWHGLDLRPEEDELWSNLHSSARRAIRKATRDEVNVRISQSREDLRTFFLMHLGVRKHKYRLLAQPYTFFENIWKQFADHDRGWLILGSHGDETIGGIMLLAWKDTIYYKFNASIASQLSHRTNDLLVWNAIQFGKSRGFEFLDFGLSDVEQEGLIRYKRKFSSMEGTISFLRSAPQHEPNPAVPDAVRLLHSITQLMTEPVVPDDATEQAGAALYHLFS